MALPRPAPARRVFRPARRVSWGTRIFSFLVFLLAAGSIGAFLEVFLPQQVASLAKLEAVELQKARDGASQVNTSVTTLWADLSKGSMGLTDEQLDRDLALAKQSQKATSDALAHLQAAEAYMAQADGMPFQLHSPSFVTSDRPLLAHLESSLNASGKLANAAAIQIPIAQAMNQNARSLLDLNRSLAARDWAAGARTAGTLATAVKLQQGPAGNPETLLDPLWEKWIDAMVSVVIDAQQLCLHSAQNLSQLAQQDSAALQNARNQMSAAYAAAQNGAATWQARTVQPILDKASREAAAAGS